MLVRKAMMRRRGGTRDRVFFWFLALVLVWGWEMGSVR